VSDPLHRSTVVLVLGPPVATWHGKLPAGLGGIRRRAFPAEELALAGSVVRETGMAILRAEEMAKLLLHVLMKVLAYRETE
jgi:hypothetical protein